MGFFNKRKRRSKSDLINMVQYNRAKKKALKNQKWTIRSPRDV